MVTRKRVLKNEVDKTKKIRKAYLITVGLVAWSLLMISIGGIILASGPTEWGTVIEPGSMVSDADYTIFVDGANYKARNGTTGAIDITSSNMTILIESVIDSASNHGMIFLKAGNYQVSYGIELVKSCRFNGEGPDTKIEIAGQQAFKIMHSDVSFKDIAFWSNDYETDWFNQSSSGLKNVTFVNCQFSGYVGSSLMEFQDEGENFVVKNCDFESLIVKDPSIAIGTDQVTYVIVTNWQYSTIIDNTFKNVQARIGIEILGPHIKVNENEFINFKAISADSWAIRFGWGESGIDNVINSEISDNRLIWTEASAYDIEGAIAITQYSGAMYPKYCRVENNDIFTESTFKVMAGIHLERQGTGMIYAISIKGNQIVGVQENALYLYGMADSAVEDNRIYEPNNRGIWLVSPCTYNLVQNNLIVNASRAGSDLVAGIELNGASTRNNTIQSNMIYDYTPYQKCAIREVTLADYNRIVSNRVNGSVGAAISVVGFNTVVRYNIGFRSEGNYTVTISASTSVTFYHLLALKPTLVLASFNVASYGNYTWSTTWTQLTITVSTSGTYTVYVYAQF